MKQNEEIKDKTCVLMNCNRKAVGVCNNCRIPVCEIHSKKTNSAYICVNCLSFLKKLKLK